MLDAEQFEKRNKELAAKQKKNKAKKDQLDRIKELYLKIKAAWIKKIHQESLRNKMMSNLKMSMAFLMAKFDDYGKTEEMLKDIIKKYK